MHRNALGDLSTGSLISLAVLALACLFAAWLDVRHRRIPNGLCAATAVAGLLGGYFLGGTSGLLSNALHCLAALVGGMVLFKLGVFGGGDAKFYAAVAAWFALAKGILLLVAVTLSGVALLIVWFTYRRVAGLPIGRKAGSGFDGLPYGIAIGAGALITATL